MTDFTTGPMRASKLLDQFQAQTGLEGDQQLMLVHLVGDLLEWCDANKVDFDAALEESREMLRDYSQG